ncbi:MAG: glycosyltransferase family 4 protein [Candidatus Sumerlaeaceae bacterium]
MKIGLNALQVRAAKSGVGQYIHALTEAMLPLAPQDKFTILCTQENVSNYSIPAPNLNPVTWGLPQQARTLRLLHEYTLLPGELKRHGFDVFHGMSNFLPLRKVCPYVVTIHDLSYYVQPERCPPVRRHYWYAMTTRSVKLADAIITVSENSRRDIARFFPGAERKTHVIPEAAHARFRRIDNPREQTILARLGLASMPYLLYVGTLEPGKNVERIVRAFDQIAREFPDHQLVLAGDKGWLYEGILAAAENAAAKERIHITGHMPDDAVVELFNFCDAFVYPSLYEGFGLPPLEAMACGAPVITSNTSSIPEVVGAAAVKVNPVKVDEIAGAMRGVLADPEFAADLRQKGMEQASKFSWGRAAAQTLEVYRKVVAGG